MPSRSRLRNTTKASGETRVGVSPLPPTSTPPPGSREAPSRAAWNRTHGSRSAWAEARLVCLGKIPASLPAKIRKWATVPWRLPLAGDKSLALSAAKGWHFDSCLPAPSHGSTLLSAGLFGGKTPACHQLPLLFAHHLPSPKTAEMGGNRAWLETGKAFWRGGTKISYSEIKTPAQVGQEVNSTCKQVCP